MKKRINAKKTGANIKRIAEEKGCAKITYLSRKFGVSNVAVSNWYNGVRLPSTQHLVEMAILFDCTIEELLIVE